MWKPPRLAGLNRVHEPTVQEPDLQGPIRQMSHEGEDRWSGVTIYLSALGMILWSSPLPNNPLWDSSFWNSRVPRPYTAVDTEVMFSVVLVSSCALSNLGKVQGQA